MKCATCTVLESPPLEGRVGLVSAVFGREMENVVVPRRSAGVKDDAERYALENASISEGMYRRFVPEFVFVAFLFGR